MSKDSRTSMNQAICTQTVWSTPEVHQEAPMQTWSLLVGKEATVHLACEWVIQNYDVVVPALLFSKGRANGAQYNKMQPFSWDGIQGSRVAYNSPQVSK